MFTGRTIGEYGRSTGFTASPADSNSAVIIGSLPGKGEAYK